MKIIAQKKNNGRIIFDLPDKSESEAIKYARDSVRKTIRERLNKRLWGWTFTNEIQ